MQQFFDHRLFMEINIVMGLLHIIFQDVKFYINILMNNCNFCFVSGVRPLSFFRVPLYASGEKTVKAPVYVSKQGNYKSKIILKKNF